MQTISVRCGTEAADKKICRFLRQNGFSPLSASDGEAACAEFALFAALPAGCWEEEALSFVNRGAAVVAIVAEKDKKRAESLLKGAAVLSFPVHPAELLQALRLCGQISSRVRALGDENERLKTELCDMKLIDRAKCALVQYLGMTEKEAHRFLEKQAMDGRRPRREVALEILKAYES